MGGSPTQEVHAFVNDLERAIGTYLYGRRLYDDDAGLAGLVPEDDGPGRDA